MINRAFISLYLIVVLSIVVLGLVLNKFWSAIEPEAEINFAIQDILQLAEINLSENKGIAEFKNFYYQISVMKLDEFSQTQLLDEIKAGKIVNASNEQNALFYKRINNKDEVLELRSPLKNHHKNVIYIAFTVIFYFAIAVIIFLWVLPLSRDLAKLAQHAKDIGKDGVPRKITISSSSIIFPFAGAFNNMAMRLEELIASQKEMTYAVSHELRTPLARMKFALAMLEEKTINQGRQLAGIRQDIFDMESLINTLLTYAGYEQQSQQLIQRPGHIKDFLKSIIARIEIDNKSSVNIVIKDDTKQEIFVCEWSLMQTVIHNLLINAVAFAKENITVTITTTNVAYVLLVEDDGPGVPLDKQQRIFESFVRLYNEHSPRSGFGLGLAIAKRIMGWHQGYVVCRTAPSGGAIFELCWPKMIR